MKTYSELITIAGFLDRYKYLKQRRDVGEETFGYRRYLNQILYNTAEWRHIRKQVIARDYGHDLAHPDFLIGGRVYVHHIEPLTLDDISNKSPKIFDLDNLVSVSNDTHLAIHFGDENLLPIEAPIRMPGDTKLW